ncbi:hypothetical protein [Nocardioides sp.]|uniref:hypothetical protein n=1 Tax=Nocardioides sp. TaxID=35761 RepID=UPI002631047E|nr:hypothetical protein [Nocardioides sp.]
MTGSDRRTSRSILAIVGVVIVLVAAALIGAHLTEDRTANRGTGVTAGDLHADRIRIRVNGVRSVAVTPLRAGDLITVHAEVTSRGAASRWIRTALDLSGTDPELAPYLSIYNGPLPTGVALKAASDVTDPITFPGYVGTAAALNPAMLPPSVLDGTTEQESVGISPYPLAVALYVDPQTPTRLLSRALALSAVVQTVEYRSHPDAPADDQWSDGPRIPLG